MENNPNLADLICEYVTERIPQYQFSTAQSITGSYHISVVIPICDNTISWSLGIASDTRYFTTLNNGKFIHLDVVCEDSLDVICKLIRLNIAKRIKRQHSFMYSCLRTKNRKRFLAWRRTFP